MINKCLTFVCFLFFLFTTSNTLFVVKLWHNDDFQDIGMAFYYKDALIKYGSCGSKTVKLKESRIDLKKNKLPLPTYLLADKPVWDDKKAFGLHTYRYQKWHEQTQYAKSMSVLSGKIWGEPTFPLNTPSARMLRTLSRPPHEVPAEKPLSFRDDKTPSYWMCQTPMFHYLTKMLKMHGLFYDAHLVWKEAQKYRRISLGMRVTCIIGEGKIKELKEKNRLAREAKRAKAKAKLTSKKYN